ncbi:MAG: alpha-L-fucosidase [Kiritimatiellia bacterium]
MKQIIPQVALASMLLSQVFAAAAPQPYGALPSPAQLAWHELEQYAFCHFTINTFTDKEWGYGDEDPTLFNPTDFDANQIVGTAKAAGMRAFILTCKHHDGFCLWPTKTTGHNISKSPWKDGKGDIVRELSDAARRHGMKFGVYLSPWDRNSEIYGTPKYIEKLRSQLTELLSNYGDIFEIWFDGANGGDGYYGGARTTRRIDRTTYYDWPVTWALANKLQPGAVLFSDVGPGVRWIGNERGIAHYPCWATYTPKGQDGRLPGPGDVQHELGQGGTVDGAAWIPGECDVSIRPGWFYHAHQDDQVKTPKQLVDLYFASVGHGASFLLNLAPDRRGQLHHNDCYSLITYGKIMEQLFSKNLAEGAKASADQSREPNADNDFSAMRVLDGERSTYWATPDNTKSATLTLDLKGRQSFDVIRLREPIALGQRVRRFAIDVRADGVWKEWVANGSSIGAHVLFRQTLVTTDGVRVRILESAACPLISEVSLWKLPEFIPHHLPVALKPGELDRSGWKIHADFDSMEHPVAHAIDGNPRTFWCTHNGEAREHAPPQSLTIDFAKDETFDAIEVLPRQDNTPHAVVDRYAVQWSADGKDWSKPLEGGFSNIRSNPIAQRIALPAPVTARHLKFTALRVLEKDNVTIAEIRLFSPP